MKKDALRIRFKNLRDKLSKEDLEVKSTLINQKLIQKIEALEPKMIHCFLPIKAMKEINTQVIFDYCWRNQINIAAPVSDFSTQTMKSALITQNTKIVKGAFNISEPESPQWIKEAEIDFVITPLLAFDQSGYRVGYGKGFYDKFFKTLSQNIHKVGVCAFEAISKIDDLQDMDVKLDQCITPINIYTF